MLWINDDSEALDEVCTIGSLESPNAFPNRPCMVMSLIEEKDDTHLTLLLYDPTWQYRMGSRVVFRNDSYLVKKAARDPHGYAKLECQSWLEVG